MDIIGPETILYEKDVNYIFRCSMMLHVDEVNVDRIF